MRYRARQLVSNQLVREAMRSENPRLRRLAKEAARLLMEGQVAYTRKSHLEDLKNHADDEDSAWQISVQSREPIFISREVGHDWIPVLIQEVR